MSSDDDLMKDIKRTKEKQSRLDKTKADVPRVHRFLYQFFQALDHILSVYLPWARKFWLTVFRWYRTVWAMAVYRRGEFGELVFSKPRAGIFLVSSVLFLLYGAVPLISGSVSLGIDTAVYLATVKHDEVLYLHNSQEIEPEENIHAVQGNYSIPLNEEETVYFLVEDTWFNTLWSIFTKGNLFYPDYVAATVPPGLNRCTTTTYGLRMKSLMRRWEVYPYILSAQCEPVSGKSID